ncbi:Ohr subfamily peroxiredoxin [Pontibacter ummariensis]|uniref:Peroxiredoxin, Ohr subfamily n=1 Tax=Pontibacter ummariensis TaxID=1610492 RepID=A0A239EUC7_9BACT|nr:organic hydroperoxide resistance protein [Pontibacter ummariensis]PRY12773.1 Ohr subfamily peroxiredoxin [Pontibacter ummariensis]SNS47492.1 peroxiredoxin, Ohr subfamily [Pontibacter ummariensis]
MEKLYTAVVTATGGRRGQVKSDDGIIDMKLSLPEGLGGQGGSTNPEQLFAAGYAACFQSALLVVAGRHGERLNPDSTVTAHVDLNKKEDDSFALSVKLAVSVKGVDKEKAKQMVDEAHQICPYSVGTRGNVDVELEVV